MANKTLELGSGRNLKKFGDVPREALACYKLSLVEDSGWSSENQNAGKEMQRLGSGGFN